MKKRVLLNAFQFDINGVSEAYLAAKWKQSLSKYISVDLVTGESISGDGIYTPSKRFEFNNRFLNRLNSAIKFDYFEFNRKSVNQLKVLIKNYDVFHHVSPVAPRYPVSLGEYANCFILGPVAGGLRVPKKFRSEIEGSEEFFIKARNIDSFRLKYDKKLLKTYESADFILVAGDYMQGILPSQFHSKFIPFLDVGVDVDLFDFKLREITDGFLNLVYVGRVVPYKGLIYLLKALAILPVSVKPLVSLSIAGDRGETDYERKCYRFVEENGLSKCVTFNGYVTKKEVNYIYDKAHVFCFPSLAEAGGTVVVEALSKGLPVIAANIGGPSESVNNSCGVLVDAQTPESLIEGFKDAIINYIEKPDLLKKASREARDRALFKYNWDVRARKMIDIYNL
ncbi:MAG: group 1 glycosyl transferase [Osedax symbiont Rs1]|nr:MAG: group 1 glycosyl transferase [Osedax symbiont Rs1]